MHCRIKELRTFKNMSLEELSEKSGISKATISSLEQGEISTTKVETFKKIAEALEVDVELIFFQRKSLVE